MNISQLDTLDFDQANRYFLDNFDIGRQLGVHCFLYKGDTTIYTPGHSNTKYITLEYFIKLSNGDITITTRRNNKDNNYLRLKNLLSYCSTIEDKLNVLVTFALIGEYIPLGESFPIFTEDEKKSLSLEIIENVLTKHYRPGFNVGFSQFPIATPQYNIEISFLRHCQSLVFSYNTSVNELELLPNIKRQLKFVNFPIKLINNSHQYSDFQEYEVRVKCDWNTDIDSIIAIMIDLK